MAIPSLQRARSEVIEAVTAHLVRRRSSAFQREGADTTRAYVSLGFDALLRDTEAGEHEAVRSYVYQLIDELSTNGMTYSDLRALCQSLRKQVRESLGEASEVGVDVAQLRVDVEAWFYELLVVSTMRFMAWRDEVFQRETAQIAVQRLESQLTELEVALSEKTELLEMIRQASTPIVPVVDGILVVPLIGIFDGHRAELLTERLLAEVARLHARTAIIDVSGVPVFDTAAAHLMMRLARCVRLIGTRVFLVGMSPDNARTLVALGIELTQIRTFATLQDGLAAARP